MPVPAFTLRDHKTEDFETLWRLDQMCFSAGIAYTREELSYFLSLKSGFAIVGERDALIQGFIVIQSDLKKKSGHVITIDVHEDARRSGLGTLLMDAAEARLKSMGFDLVLLEVAVNNSPAISFYKRHGYAVLKTLPRYYLNTIDGLMLGKKISG